MAPELQPQPRTEQPATRQEVSQSSAPRSLKAERPVPWDADAASRDWAQEGALGQGPKSPEEDLGVRQRAPTPRGKAGRP